MEDILSRRRQRDKNKEDAKRRRKEKARLDRRAKLLVQYPLAAEIEEQEVQHILQLKAPKAGRRSRVAAVEMKQVAQEEVVESDLLGWYSLSPESSTASPKIHPRAPTAISSDSDPLWAGGSEDSDFLRFEVDFAASMAREDSERESRRFALSTLGFGFSGHGSRRRSMGSPRQMSGFLGTSQFHRSALSSHGFAFSGRMGSPRQIPSWCLAASGSVGSPRQTSGWFQPDPNNASQESRATTTASSEEDNDGCTPLYAAAINGHRDVVKLLLQIGASVSEEAEDGSTPLYAAASNGHRDVVELLFQNGASVNEKNKDGWTPLYTAARYGRKDVVEIFLQNGASVSEKAKDGSTPLYAAASNGHKDIVEFLFQNGVSASEKTTDGSTPLYAAASNGHGDVVEFLLQNGASVSEEDSADRLIAASIGHKDIVDLLFQNMQETVERTEWENRQFTLAEENTGWVQIKFQELTKRNIVVTMQKLTREAAIAHVAAVVRAQQQVLAAEVDEWSDYLIEEKLELVEIEESSDRSFIEIEWQVASSKLRSDFDRMMQHARQVCESSLYVLVRDALFCQREEFDHRKVQKALGTTKSQDNMFCLEVDLYAGYPMDEVMRWALMYEEELTLMKAKLLESRSELKERYSKAVDTLDCVNRELHINANSNANSGKTVCIPNRPKTAPTRAAPRPIGSRPGTGRSLGARTSPSRPGTARNIPTNTNRALTLYDPHKPGRTSSTSMLSLTISGADAKVAVEKKRKRLATIQVQFKPGFDLSVGTTAPAGSSKKFSNRSQSYPQPNSLEPLSQTLPGDWSSQAFETHVKDIKTYLKPLKRSAIAQYLYKQNQK